MSPQQSEKCCSEVQIRLGSQVGKPQRKNTHQVVWEKLPAETSISGLPRTLSVEEDPFPEFLKEEQFSDQGSLLREMNDAIAALSMQLKPQAPAALAEAACCLQHDAERQKGPEAATLHGSAIGAPRNTHVGHKLFKEDLREGRTAAELPARDMTQASASTEELGAEQGNSMEGAGQGLEEVKGTLFGKGKGADEKGQILKEAERPQRAPRERKETADQEWVEVEEAEWVHKKTEQEKAQLPGDAEEAALSQGENLEATPEGWELELVPGWDLARDVHGEPGGCLELELICRGEVQMAAKQEDSVLPGVTTVSNPKNVDGEGDGAEVQSWGQDKGTVQVDAEPAQVHGAKHGRSHGAACELLAEAAEEERGAGEAMQGGQGDAWLQPSGEDFGDMKEGTSHAHVLEAVPQAETQEGAVVAGVQQLEALSSAASVQLLAELGELEASPGGSPAAELQHQSVAGAPGIEQAGSMGPDVQPLEGVGRAQPGLEERTSAAAVLGEGLSPAETPMEYLGLPRLVLINAQTLGMEEAEHSPAETLLHGGLIPEAPRDVGRHMAIRLAEEAGDGGQGPSESGLPNQPLLDPQGAEAGLAEGAASEVPQQKKAGSMEVLEALSSAASVQLLAELGELEASPGGSPAAELQHQSVAGAPGTEQAGSMGPDVQPLEGVGRAQPGLEERTSAAAVLGEGLSPAETPMEYLGLPRLVLINAQTLGMEEAEHSPAETLLHGGLIPEAPRDVGRHMAIRLAEEAGDGGQGPSESGLPNQPLLDPQGAEAGLAEGAASEVPQQKKAGSMEVLEALSSAASVQLLAELGELEASPGGSPAAELQHQSVAGAPGTEQAGSMGPDVQPLEGVGRAQPGLEERTSAAAVLGEGLSPTETPVGSPVPDGLVQDNAQELKLKEAESLVQVEELLSTPGGSTWADLQPLVEEGTGEVAQSQAVALEVGLCNTDVWDGDADAPVPLPAVAALHPEYASATKYPYPDVKLVALNDPDEQALEENQALEIFQEESADAKGRPLDGAQGLGVVQGARVEAETRILVEVQHLELKQGHDTNAATLAASVSEVPLQISTLNWNMVMQEDVLVPDVQWLGGSGQAAQSELLEQVSSQKEKMRLHAAPQQPQEKPPCVIETKQVAAGPAEPPKQEVPPVSAFCTRVQEQEDTGNDLLGMNLRDSTLMDAANSRVQPQRHLSEEWREDLDVGQPEKKKEMGHKMSQEGEPSPGEPGAMTVNGAGASPRGSSEVSLDPDHLYNVLFVGDSHVGKTSFLYRLHANTFNPHLTATVGLDYQVKSLIMDNKHFALRLWDSAGQER
uniref:Ras-related protein Rab-44 n=1 Tax=Anas zonorhyncha TaxID=75864 RepID=A0A8B9USX8_9AVES